MSDLFDVYVVGVRGVILPRGKGTFRGQRYGYQVTLKVTGMLEALRWIRSDIAPAGRDSEKASKLVDSKLLVRFFNRVGMVWTERVYDDRAEVV